MDNIPLIILLADDDEADRLIFSDAFSELEVKTDVQTVNNGIELMKCLNNEKEQLPDLLFLDLNMPRKNGIECLKEIKGIEKLSKISIAIYSTSENDKDVEEAFLNGANIYISKPNDYSLLKKILLKAVSTTLLYRGDSLNRDNFILKA